MHPPIGVLRRLFKWLLRARGDVTRHRKPQTFPLPWLSRHLAGEYLELDEAAYVSDGGYQSATCLNEIELQEVFAFGANEEAPFGFFDAATGMDAAALTERWRKCPEAIMRVVRVHPQSGDRRFIGYYSVLPITTRCVRAIERKQIEKGRQIRPGDVQRTFDNPAAVYISVVYGERDGVWQAAVRRHLLLRLSQLVNRLPSLTHAYVRPTSHQGRAAVNRLTGRESTDLESIERIDLRLLNWGKLLNEGIRRRQD
jgi:hypothetical protein